MSKVTLGKGKWLEQLRYLATEVLPYQYDVLCDRVKGIPASHSVSNYQIAAGIVQGTHQGMLFQDSDLTKWLEAASWSLHTVASADMEARIAEMTELLAAAMAADGYLDTYYQCNHLERLSNLAHGHELYCMGHLIEAGVAHFTQTGETRLLRLAERAGDYLCSAVGNGPQQKNVYSGHPEIEAALLALAQATGRERYRRLAEHMLNARGEQPSFLLRDSGYQTLYTGHWYDLTYHQAHQPVREQRDAEGHAVRAVYLYRAMAMLCEQTGDQELRTALCALWHSVCAKRMYVTGGIGSEAHGERFSTDYDLPNDRAYAETCASIGVFLWAWQMHAIDPDSQYADMMEWELYNGILSGMSADGRRYFYVNPLELRPEEAAFRYDMSHVEAERLEWFGCACCPPNLMRLLLSLHRYLFRDTPDGFALEQYVSATRSSAGEKWTVRTDYPASGEVELCYEGAAPVQTTVRLRVPAWCKEAVFRLNGQELSLPRDNGYAIAARAWQPGDSLHMTLVMQPRFLRANPRVAADAGQVCLTYGPMVYCLEERDNGEGLHQISIRTDTVPRTTALGEPFGSLPGLQGQGCKLRADPDGPLYTDAPPVREPFEWTAVPYHLWGNRGKGEMRVWLREECPQSTAPASSFT